jgi:hypothetical protein
MNSIIADAVVEGGSFWKPVLEVGGFFRFLKNMQGLHVAKIPKELMLYVLS